MNKNVQLLNCKEFPSLINFYKKLFASLLYLYIKPFMIVIVAIETIDKPVIRILRRLFNIA